MYNNTKFDSLFHKPHAPRVKHSSLKQETTTYTEIKDTKQTEKEKKTRVFCANFFCSDHIPNGKYLDPTVVSQETSQYISWTNIHREDFYLFIYIDPNKKITVILPAISFLEIQPTV